GHALVEGVLLGAEADLEVEVRIVPDRLAEDLERSLARPQLTGDELHERRLAGAIRAEQARDARPHRHGDVVQPHHLAVPLRDVLGRQHRGAHVTPSTPRTRRSSTEIDTTTRPTTTMSDTSQGVE